MKRFAFKLEPLFDYRKRLEEISRKEFSEALKKLDEEEARLSLLRDVYKKTSAEIDGLKERGAPFGEIDLYYSYAAGLKKHIADQERIIREVRKALERKRAELHQASKNKKVIETIKEKSYNSHMEMMNKLEQKASDDLVTSRFKRSAEE